MAVYRHFSQLRLPTFQEGEAAEAKQPADTGLKPEKEV